MTRLHAHFVIHYLLCVSSFTTLAVAIGAAAEGKYHVKKKCVRINGARDSALFMHNAR